MNPSDWNNITYLSNGNIRQQRAYAVLTGHRVLHTLAAFDPILVGTVPIGIDVVGSDLDISCHSADLETFSAIARSVWGDQPDFQAHRLLIREEDSVVINFTLDGFPVELFAQDVPVERQHAFRHLVVEHRILQQRGEAFRKQVIALKEQGVGTEPAFAQLLGLQGDPYLALLELEGN